MASRARLALAAAAWVLPSVAMRPEADVLHGAQNPVLAYEAFRHTLGVNRPGESADAYQDRVSLFQARSQAIAAHNTRPDVGWVATLNKFADFTDAEFHALLGHRRYHSGQAEGASIMPHVQSWSSSFHETTDDELLDQVVDWTRNLSFVGRHAKDQYRCGSCWAIAVTGSIEVHAEINGLTLPELSSDELVDCVANPNQCGGFGGCNGVSAELTMLYIKEHGLSDRRGYGPRLRSTPKQQECKQTPNKVVSIGGFIRLPENENRPLQLAVAKKGPVVVSADARTWGPYESGVMDTCEKDAVVNHALLCLGYGTDEKTGKDYWLVRNSWGDTDWGEMGYIRVLKHKDGESYCGVDHEPMRGLACRGGPSKLPVCGMCGILSNSIYPTGIAAYASSGL